MIISWFVTLNFDFYTNRMVGLIVLVLIKLNETHQTAKTSRLHAAQAN